jgi:hypothetical protein
VIRSRVNRVPPSRLLSALWPHLLSPFVRIPPLGYGQIGNDKSCGTNPNATMFHENYICTTYLLSHLNGGNLANRYHMSTGCIIGKSHEGRMLKCSYIGDSSNHCKSLLLYSVSSFLWCFDYITSSVIWVHKSVLYPCKSVKELSRTESWRCHHMCDKIDNKKFENK